MAKRQFEKETSFGLRREHYEELYIETNVIMSITLLILVKCRFYSNQNKVVKNIFEINLRSWFFIFKNNLHKI